MKLNRGGLILAGIYAGIFVLLVALRFAAVGAKAVYILGQLLVFPALALLIWSGLVFLFPDDSWINNLFVLASLSLVIVYLVGWAISAIVHFRDNDPPDPPDGGPPVMRPSRY